MAKLILIIVFTICQGMKDLKKQTINLSGGQEQEHRIISKILANIQNIRGLNLKEEVSKERKAKSRGHIFRKLLKRLLSNTFAKANKKMKGLIEIELKKTQPNGDGHTLKTIPIVVNGQRYSRFIRFS